MSVDLKDSAGKSEYIGKEYYFSSLGCKKAFDKEPEKYINMDHLGHSSHKQESIFVKSNCIDLRELSCFINCPRGIIMKDFNDNYRDKSNNFYYRTFSPELVWFDCCFGITNRIMVGTE